MLLNLWEELENLGSQVLIINGYWQINICESNSQGLHHGLMDKDLVAVDLRNSSGEDSVLASMIGSLDNIVECSIEIDSNSLVERISLGSLSCGEIERVIGIKNVCHEVASTFFELQVQIIDNLLDCSVDLR